MSQTFVGGVAIAVTAGLILLFFEKGVLTSILPGSTNAPHRPPIITVPPPQPPSTTEPPSPIKDNSLKKFFATVGIAKSQIVECVQRNSSRFVLDRDYSLEEARDSFGEVIIKLYVHDEGLEALLRVCSSRRVN
jgi:hypothetical protein